MKRRLLGMFCTLACVWMITFPPVTQSAPRDIYDVYTRQDTQSWGSRLFALFHTHEFSRFNKSYAIVIGLGDYTGDWSRLESPYHDAVRVREYLINEANFDYVVTLTNQEATKATIEHYMEDVFPGIVRENDRFFFYFSGHGTQRQLAERVRGYLPMLKSRRGEWSKMISMDDIEQWYEGIAQARHILFLLDSCFSGLAGVQAKGDRPHLLMDGLSRVGHHLLTAGSAEQESVGSLKEWNGSLFTYAVLEGLRGAADTETPSFKPDGVVSLTELITHIKHRVTAAKADNPGITQWPQMSELRVKSEGEFFFITESRSREAVAMEQGGSKADAIEPKGRGQVSVNCQGNRNTENGPALARMSTDALRQLLQFCAAPPAGSSDPGFTVEAVLNKLVFVSGDKAVMSVTCSQDCNLTIFNLDATGHVTRLYPSERLSAEAQSPNPLRAGQELVFPPPTSGFDLELNPVFGYDRNSEAFFIIATKPPLYLHALGHMQRPIWMGDLFRLLLDLPATEWAQAQLVYEVRDKNL